MTPQEHADQVLAGFDGLLIPEERQRLHAAIVEALNAYASPRVERFDGAAWWRTIPADERDQLGAVLVEWGFATLACEAIGDAQLVLEGVVPRAMAAASTQLELALLGALGNFLPESVYGEGVELSQLPIPSLIGRVCRKCGCSDHDGCGMGCSWVEADLCSACVEPAPFVASDPRE
jgi:hypothetical protein